MIDLHTHSTASDGKLTPTELVNRATEMNIEVLALTDHDTLSGLEEASAAADAVGLRFIPGIEISAEFSPGTMHMLGYYIDAADAGLDEKLTWLRDGRNQRNRLILRKLEELGCPLDWDEVAALAGGESMGRPHIAGAMIARGYVDRFEEAFNRYLGKGAPAYVDREKMTPEKAVMQIRAAGGLPVLAHPRTLGLDNKSLSKLVSKLKDIGLAGLEAYYYSHSEEETAMCESMASRYDLLVTGGTDYHGEGMMGTELGVGLGNMNVPACIADRLTAARGVTSTR